jgi:uncharacterized lipoprotein YmbA
MKILSILLVWLLMLLSGCGSQPLESHQYLLRPAELQSSTTLSPTVRLSRVEVATYLDREGIVLLTGDAEINEAKQHTWAEPLSQSIRRYLQVTVGVAAGVDVEVPPLTTGDPVFELEVSIQQLHGSIDGEVVLVAEWSLSGADYPPRLFQFEARRKQRGDGYAALVEEHTALLDGLAEDIADQLKAAD